MTNEAQAVETMYQNPEIRSDLFSVKKVCEATGLSRASIIKLEGLGFLTPKEIRANNGYRYYDTFNVFKLLQYKRLRLMGLTQKEILEFYQTGNEEIEEVLSRMRNQRRLLDEQIELLSLRTEQERNYSFSFYDFNEITCLTVETEIYDMVQANAVGYNLSVEALARGLKPLATEEMFTEQNPAPLSNPETDVRRVKIFQPIDPVLPKDCNQSGIEVAPACHTFSILYYGAEGTGGIREHLLLLLDEVKKRGLTPTGAPLRVQWIVARYTAMHLEEKDHVARIALPVE